MRTAADRDLVARRRVADDGATAPCFMVDAALGSACTLEDIARVVDFFTRSVCAQDCLCGIARLGH